MGDMFVIVSKAIFEKEARVDGEVAGLGDVWPVDRYKGTGEVFENTLGDGGRIFMVTVRPPDEQLWLVAVLESPEFDGKSKSWVAAPNTVKVTNLSSLRKSIKFESGKGMSQEAGRLGMSLQTPRPLGPGDAEQILGLTGGGGGGGGKGKKASASEAAPAKASKPPVGKLTTRSHDRVAALLAAIRDEPDDVANREVLADQYEAGGDVDRARFIRAQLARAGMPRWDARVPALVIDERELLAAHREAWIGELPAIKGVTYTDFERGLVAWVEIEDAALIPKVLGKAMEAAPISGLAMTWPRRGARPKLAAFPGLKKLTISGTMLQKADMTWLAESPILSTIEELELERSRLDDKALAALLESPHLGKLRRLRLPYHHLSNKGIATLVEASLPQLVELDLHVETMDNVGSGGRDGDAINGEGVIALCEWPQMAKLTHLDLTGLQIGDEGLAALLTSPNTKRIKSLRIRSVSDYDFEMDDRPDVLCAFEHAKGDRTYDELDIGENELTADAVKHLKGSPVLAQLKTFAFDFSHSDDQLAKLFADATWLDGIHVMSLEETTLPVVKKLLGRAPKALHTLSLASNFPRSELEGIAGVLTKDPLKTLQVLDLRGCKIDDAGLKKLGATKTLPALIELDLGSNDSLYGDDENPYGDDAAKAFVASPLGKQLRSLMINVDGLDRFPKEVSGGGGDGDDDDEDFDDDDE